MRPCTANARRPTVDSRCRGTTITMIWYDINLRPMTRHTTSTPQPRYKTTPRYILNCRTTNCELLRWFVKMPSRDVHHYRMINALRLTVCHYNDKRSRYATLYFSRGKVMYTDIAVCRLTCYTATWTHVSEDHTVLPATRQRWHSRLYPQLKLVLD